MEQNSKWIKKTETETATTTNRIVINKWKIDIAICCKRRPESAIITALQRGERQRQKQSPTEREREGDRATSCCLTNWKISQQSINVFCFFCQRARYRLRAWTKYLSNKLNRSWVLANVETWNLILLYLVSFYIWNSYYHHKFMSIT